MSLPTHTRRMLLAAVPAGMPRESDFVMDEIPLPACPPRGLLIRSTWISVDPYLRGRISGVRSYIDPILVGSVMESSAVGEVLLSQHPDFQPGDIVSGFWQWQDYVAVADLTRVLKLDPAEAPVSTALGLLGMPGMTAYFGLTELCAPRPGETVFVSGAAGAVGSAVAQIAKILGCRVVGSAGTAEKIAYLQKLGLDGTLNYRNERPYAEALQRLCPQGIDCYFDNVGGELSDAIYTHLNFRGRVAICGQISRYNEQTPDIGPRPFLQILVKQLRIEGFIVSRWFDRFPEGRRQMSTWLREGKLRYEETIYDGLESAPQAFLGLFQGENTGKAVVRL